MYVCTALYIYVYNRKHVPKVCMYIQYNSFISCIYVCIYACMYVVCYAFYVNIQAVERTVRGIGFRCQNIYGRFLLLDFAKHFFRGSVGGGIEPVLFDRGYVCTYVCI